METIIIIITLVIFLLLAIKKSYAQILISLIVYLVLDWAVVNVFSTTPLIGGIATSVGKPILSLLTYAVIELICMGVFYYTLKRYNYIISLIVYLIINFIINKFYMPISGNILLDLLFNLIIGIMIIIANKEINEMEEIKWFAIIGMIINTFLTILATNLWKPVMEIILFLGMLLSTVFIPLMIPVVPGLILSAIIIWFTMKKLINKSETFKIVICVIILLLCECVSIITGNLFLKYESARPDKLYVEMKKIDDNETLIGLSKKQVVELLGEPQNKSDEEAYIYSAGKISNMLLFGESDFYHLRIVFDENGIVTSTSIRMDT